MCGIAGILYADAYEQGPDWGKLDSALHAVVTCPIDGQEPPDQLVESLEQATVGIRGYRAYAALAANKALQQRIAAGALGLQNFEDSTRAAVLNRDNPLSSKLIEHWNSVWTRLRDLGWALSQDLLANLGRVELILPSAASQEQSFHAWQITAVLENIGRLEVRGRDSLGISVLATFPNAQAYQDYLYKLHNTGLASVWKARLQPGDFPNLAVRLSTENSRPCALFVYKISQEVGALGDNVRALREHLRNDALLWLALDTPGLAANVFSHTRWASNGIISEVNCHPVDESTLGPTPFQSPAFFAAAVNGDIDNFQDLAVMLANKHGRSISPRITTDSKIVPMLVAHNYQQTKDVEVAFRTAVRTFEGSAAIVMHCSHTPDKTYLALKGSGQSLFVGLVDGGYVFASELYGLVEQTSRFIRLDGTIEATSGHPETSGQILVIDQTKSGLEGLRAYDISGKALPLTEDDINTAEITTRDINRGNHEHFLLKEIFDAPNSVEKTLLGKVYASESDNKEDTKVNLGPEVFPERLTESFKAGCIKRILLIGQGTAAVAGNAVASMMQTVLAGSGLDVRAVKATELSGYAMKQDMSDALVLAVSQSGTTTDTNRTVDLVRSCGATVIAIVNRRNSDLVYKVDGVLYTSDGRDIEMSVASTKAFYSQVVAGYILGLHIANLLGTLDEREIRREVLELQHLPSKMLSILENRGHIEKLAHRFATTRRDWAVVGSGCTKAAADEIRIKLSELCYKSIATDFIEDKKHIDLSSEPLTLICTAGLSTMALRDAVKEVAIFKSHKSLPIVVCAEGFEEFERYAAGVIYVPDASSNASVLLNTVVGHLWGYYCALAINEGANRLRPGRALGVHHLTSDGGLILTQSNMKCLLSIGKAFQDDMKHGRMNSSLSVDTAVKLSLIFQYFTDARSLRQFTLDFTGNSLVETMVAVLSQAIAELSRPIDAIKHQAKTITVGISRSTEVGEGPVFEALKALGVTPEDLPYRDLAFIRALTLAIESVTGVTLYEIDGLNALNEVTEQSTIKVLKKTGIAANLRSRSDFGNPLVGTKQWVVNNRRSYIGHGRNDRRPMLITPIVVSGRVDQLALLHVSFVKDLVLASRVDMIKNLTNRYGDLKSQVEETNLIWRDEFLNLLSVEELATLRAAELAELIMNRQPAF